MEIRKFKETDIPSLKIFCEECKKLGWKNNESIEAMKIDTTIMPYGQYFIATKEEKIFSIAGVHRLPEIGPNAWRCLFRGAQLPGYTPAWSMDIFKSGIHFAYFLYEQIMFVREIDQDAEFFITTNIDNPDAGASSRLNKVMMPRLAGKGYWTLHFENFVLYNTEQNIWKVNVEKYLADRKEWQNISKT